MIQYETNIDTFAMQLDFKTPEEQRIKFDLLMNWVIGRRLGHLNKNGFNNSKVNRYDLYYGRRKLATIHTASSHSKYYIRIRFAGLKSFDQSYDDASYNALFTISAFLNTTRTPFRFVELDIAIDMFCPFDNVLGIISSPVSNVDYNPLGAVQYYDGIPTSYLEDYSDSRKRKSAFMRFYIYNKTGKEKLGFTVTRGELKLQNRFFLRNGFNVDSIVKAYDKYQVYYFTNPIQKQYIMDEYPNFRDISNSDLCKIEAENNRMFLNSNVIKEFIRQVQSSYVGFFGNVVIPSL